MQEVLQSSTPASSLKGWAWQEDILLRNWQLMVMLGIEGNAQVMAPMLACRCTSELPHYAAEEDTDWSLEAVSSRHHQPGVQLDLVVHWQPDNVADLSSHPASTASIAVVLCAAASLWSCIQNACSRQEKSSTSTAVERTDDQPL